MLGGLPWRVVILSWAVEAAVLGLRHVTPGYRSKLPYQHIPRGSSGFGRLPKTTLYLRSVLSFVGGSSADQACTATSRSPDDRPLLCHLRKRRFSEQQQFLHREVRNLVAAEAARTTAPVTTHVGGIEGVGPKPALDMSYPYPVLDLLLFSLRGNKPSWFVFMLLIFDFFQ